MCYLLGHAVGEIIRSEHLFTVRIFKNNMYTFDHMVIWNQFITWQNTLLYILLLFIYFIISFFIREYNYFDIVFLDRNKANGLLHMQLAEPVKLEVSVTVMCCSVWDIDCFMFRISWGSLYGKNNNGNTTVISKRDKGMFLVVVV